MKDASSWVSLFIRLESEPHLMPDDAAVDGFIAYSFIDKTENSVIMDQLILTGQYQTFALLLPRSINGGLQQFACIALTAAGRNRIDAKDHLPGPLFIMERGIGIHLVCQIRFIGHHAVDESQEPSRFIKKQPKMVAIMAQAPFKFIFRRCFSRRKASRFNSRNGL